MVKILNVLFVLTGLLLLGSCTGDDFKRESDNPRIQGEWKQTLTHYEMSGETLPVDFDVYYTLNSNNTGYTYYRGTVAEIEWSFVNNAFRYRYLGSALEKHGNGIRGFDISEFDTDGFWTTDGDYYQKAIGETPDYEALLEEQYGGGYGNDGGDEEEDEGNSIDTDNGEVPDIWLEDYTCYSTQLQLTFRFESESKINSAEINYGTSRSNLSRTKRATVTGTTIKANITGLTNGETYYFRAKAKNSAGEGTSETIRIIYQWKD